MFRFLRIFFRKERLLGSFRDRNQAYAPYPTTSFGLCSIRILWPFCWYFFRSILPASEYKQSHTISVEMDPSYNFYNLSTLRFELPLYVTPYLLSSANFLVGSYCWSCNMTQWYFWHLFYHVHFLSLAFYCWRRVNFYWCFDSISACEDNYLDIIDTDPIKIILVVKVIDPMTQTLVLFVELLSWLLFLHLKMEIIENGLLYKN